MKTDDEVRQLYKDGNVREFNKEMAKRTPVRNGCVDLSDILDSLNKVMKFDEKEK